VAANRKNPAAFSDDRKMGDDPFDHEVEAEFGEAGRGGIPDIFRRVMTLGLSGLFTTEAAIRGALGDSVPREWVDFVSEQSERTRADFTQRLAEEFGKILEDVDVLELAEQLLEGRTLEVKAEFKLGPRRTDPTDD
jgi:hypothetical protein